MLYNIILIDDNPEMLDHAREEWKKYGGCLTNVHSAKEAIEELKKKEYHLIKIVADYVRESLLPSINKIRDATDMPIVVMTSHYDSALKVAALRCGADEYLAVPETSEEILMTGFAHIRRYCSFDCGRHDKKVITYQGIRLDLRERKVTVGGRDVYLSRGEFECLRMLMSNPGSLFTYELLYYGSYGEEARAEDILSSVRSFIKRIRKKIGADYDLHIQAVHGVGYKLEKTE